MRVEVLTDSGELASARVTDADVLTALSVSVAADPAPGTDDTAIDAALSRSGLGHREGDHVWLSLERLRADARALATLPDWDEKWEAMIAYAESKGWVDGESDTVRAHLERSA